MHYEKRNYGDIIYKEGGLSTHKLYIVLSGSVWKLKKYAENG